MKWQYIDNESASLLFNELGKGVLSYLETYNAGQRINWANLDTAMSTISHMRNTLAESDKISYQDWENVKQLLPDAVLTMNVKECIKGIEKYIAQEFRLLHNLDFN